MSRRKKGRKDHDAGPVELAGATRPAGEAGPVISGNGEEPHAPWWPLPPIAAVLLGFALLCSVARIGAPLYYDEAYTIMQYASRPYATIVTDYSAPNNHIAHSIMLHTWSLFIEDPAMFRRDTWVLRIPALALTVLGLIAFYVAARRLVSPAPAVAAAATAFYFCHPEVLPLTLALRGYGGALALLCCGLALLAHHDDVHPVLYAAGIAVVIWLANYAVPSNVWFTGPFAVAAVLVGHRGAAVAGGAIGFGMTLLCYLPVLDQMRKAASQFGSGPLLPQLPGRFIEHWKQMLDAAGHGPWPVALAVLAAGAAVLCLLARTREAARRTAWIALTVAALWSPIATVMSGNAFTRNYVPGRPFFALLQIWAIAGAAAWLAGRDPERERRAQHAVVAALALVALVCGVRYVTAHARHMSPDEVMRTVREQSGDRTLVLIGEQAELAAHVYYARVEGIHNRVTYYQSVQPELVRSWPDVWFIHVGDHDLGPMLKHHGITPEIWKAHARRVRTVGGTHIEALTRSAPHQR